MEVLLLHPLNYFWVDLATSQQYDFSLDVCFRLDLWFGIFRQIPVKRTPLWLLECLFRLRFYDGRVMLPFFLSALCVVGCPVGHQVSRSPYIPQVFIDLILEISCTVRSRLTGMPTVLVVCAGWGDILKFLYWCFWGFGGRGPG